MTQKENHGSRQLSDAEKREIIKKRRRRKSRRDIAFWVTEIFLALVVVVCAVGLNILGRFKHYVTVDDDALYKPSYGTTAVADASDIETAIETVESGESSVVIVPTTKASETEATTAQGDTLSDSEYTTFVIFGVDARESSEGGLTDEGTNSDVMIVASVNNNNGEIRMVSVYRDTLLKDYATDKYGKANNSYCMYGYVDAINTLALNLDLSVDYFICIDWTAAIEVISVLGGVDVEMKACYKQIHSTESVTGYVPYFNGLINEIVTETGIGTTPIPDEAFVDGLIYHLDGVQAVAYMRMRKTDSDFNRTQRQREVMTQCLELAKQADVGTLLSIVDIIGEHMVFNISQNSIIGMLTNISKFNVAYSGGYPYHLYDGSGYTGKMKYCITTVNVAQNVMELHANLYPDQTYTPSQELLTINEEMRVIGQFDENWNLNITTTE